MNKPLLLIGGGGHCKSVMDVVEELGMEVLGILDLPQYLGRECMGKYVIGCDEDIPRFVDECDFIVTVGFIHSSHLRLHLHHLVESAGGTLATIVAKSAQVSAHASIGCGTVVLRNACVNAGAKIGKGCIINTLANIEHGASVGDFSHVSTGVMVNGDCHIGQACFIGSGSILYNGIEIEDNISVGAASVVARNLQKPGTYLGNPLRYIG